jgi:lysozyme
MQLYDGAIPIAVGLIKGFEGRSLKAYPDPATGGAPWTIGYGATGFAIRQGTVWSPEQCELDLLNRVRDIALFIDKEVNILLTDEELAALISFVYNVGRGNFDHSTLLVKLNEKDIAGAAKEFLRWDKAAGKVMAGLTKRRSGEMAEFLLGANFGERIAA